MTNDYGKFNVLDDEEVEEGVDTEEETADEDEEEESWSEEGEDL